jgi:hypothetical protein
LRLAHAAATATLRCCGSWTPLPGHTSKATNRGCGGRGSMAPSPAE